MKDRIAHIIRAKNLTAAEFAIKLGIQPSNVSHLLAGRNNPSLDFVKKLKETFPEYNLDWIIFGRGPMTLSEPFHGLPDTDPRLFESQESENVVEGMERSLFSVEKENVVGTNDRLPQLSNGELRQIILVYDDGTFEKLMPR